MTPAKAPSSEPIDAVYTWDGKAPLRYSLRSLSRYAPWIRNVYVVTAGEPPAWLARKRPRLSVVKVEDPWQMFRIAGVSRQFLWLDAGLFLGQPLTAADFLTSKGGYRFFVEAADVPPGGAAESLLNSRFGNRSPRRQVARTPRLLDRNFLEEVNRLWEKPIQQGGVSLDTLYFYFLAENRMQYGAHEKAEITPELYRTASLSDRNQVKAMLSGGPRFFSLEGEPSFGARLLLFFRYWRKSVFEK